MPNILINPNSGLMEFTTGTAGGSSFNPNFTGGAFASRLGYDNYGSLNLTSYVSNVTGLDRFSIDGANGRLFLVTDDLSGSLFSVNDIAGLPIIEAFDNNTVVMGAFNRNDFVLTGNALGLGGLPNTGNTKLYISGNTLIIGNLNVTGNILISGNPVATNLNLISTGSTLDNKINVLSGVSVLTFGDQTITGNKTFTQTGDFQTVKISKNRLLSYDYETGSFNFADYITIVSCPLTGSGDFATGILPIGSPQGNISGLNFFLKNINVCPVLITGSGNYGIDTTPNLYIYSGESVELIGVNAPSVTGWFTLNTNLGVV